MGLDGVELIMEVEEHFGITITDDEAGSMHTVGDLVAMIQSRADAASSSKCLSFPAFLSLRRLVREVVGDNSIRIRPSQSVADRLSHEHRRQLWRRLPELLGCEPRALQYPRSIRAILNILSLLLIAIAFRIAAIDWRMLPLTLCIAIALIILLHYATTSLRVVPHNKMEAIGDITRLIVGRTAITNDLDLATDSTIFDEIKPIVMDILGVDAGEVFLEARFVEDLGVG